MRDRKRREQEVLDQLDKWRAEDPVAFDRAMKLLARVAFTTMATKK